jgi:hypothetical protein
MSVTPTVRPPTHLKRFHSPSPLPQADYSHPSSSSSRLVPPPSFSLVLPVHTQLPICATPTVPHPVSRWALFLSRAAGAHPKTLTLPSSTPCTTLEKYSPACPAPWAAPRIGGTDAAAPASHLASHRGVHTGVTPPSVAVGVTPSVTPGDTSTRPPSVTPTHLPRALCTEDKSWPRAPTPGESHWEQVCVKALVLPPPRAWFPSPVGEVLITPPSRALLYGSQ